MTTGVSGSQTSFLPMAFWFYSFVSALRGLTVFRHIGYDRHLVFKLCHGLTDGCIGFPPG
jgi:hypothetical protein